jgi:hypothetical protein
MPLVEEEEQYNNTLYKSQTQTNAEPDFGGG